MLMAMLNCVKKTVKDFSTHCYKIISTKVPLYYKSHDINIS